MPRWVWDPVKDKKNLALHALSLADGVFVLDNDPHSLSRPDPHPDEERWQTVGSAGGVVLLFVVHTDGEAGRPGRIISVRKATPHERRAYEAGWFE